MGKESAKEEQTGYGKITITGTVDGRSCYKQITSQNAKFYHIHPWKGKRLTCKRPYSP